MRKDGEKEIERLGKNFHFASDFVRSEAAGGKTTMKTEKKKKQQETGVCWDVLCSVKFLHCVKFHINFGQRFVGVSEPDGVTQRIKQMLTFWIF